MIYFNFKHILSFLTSLSPLSFALLQKGSYNSFTISDSRQYTIIGVIEGVIASAIEGTIASVIECIDS